MFEQVLVLEIRHCHVKLKVGTEWSLDLWHYCRSHQRTRFRTEFYCHGVCALLTPPGGPDSLRSNKSTERVHRDSDDVKHFDIPLSWTSVVSGASNTEQILLRLGPPDSRATILSKGGSQ